MSRGPAAPRRHAPRAAATLALLLAAPLARASLYPSVSTGYLRRHAEVIALVEIVEAERLHESGGCGMRYVGRVVHAIKGLGDDAGTIEFGTVAGKDAGERFLVFLWRRDIDAENAALGFPRVIPGHDCTLRRPALLELNALEVARPPECAGEECVLFLPDAVRPPSGLPGRRLAPSEGMPWRRNWVPLRSVLRRLGSRRGSPPAR